MIPIRGVPEGRSWPWITVGLIALNILVFLYQQYIGPKATMALFYQGGAVAAKLSRVKVVGSRESLWFLATIFISMFLHGGWFHLYSNMWFLWIFGEALEEDLGHVRFLGFYLFTGFFACLAHVLAASDLSAPLIGASGAIAGVMGGYLVRLPQSPILTVVFWRLRPEFAYVPAFVWLGIWLALQLYGLRQGGPIAWMAHLGGFVIGLLTVSLFTPVRAKAAKANPRKPAKKRANPGKKK